MDKFRIAIVVKTVGHYHVARFNHLASSEEANNVELLCISLASTQSEYKWGDSSNTEYIFPCKTLVSGEELEKVSGFNLAFRLCRLLKESNIDLLINSNYSSFPMFIAAMYMRFFRSRVSAVISDSTWVDRRRYLVIEKTVKRIAVLPYAMSLAAGVRSEEYLNFLGFKDRQIFKSADVVDNNFIRAQSLEAVSFSELDSGYFLCVCRLIWEKNLPMLFSAYSSYKRKCVLGENRKLVICGDGPIREKLIKTIKQLDLVDDIILVGYVPQSEIYKYYANARVVILASVSETWGLVVNESMAAGVPVLISNRCGCVPELLLENDTGWVFDPCDSGDLSSKLHYVSNLDQHEINRMSENCLRHISKWNLSAFTSGVIQITDCAMSNRNAQ